MSDSCGNCGAEIKTTMFSSNGRLSETDISLINTVLENKLVDACGKCGQSLVLDAIGKLTAECASLQSDLERSIAAIPIISIPSPQGWFYHVVGMVTAQSVTGTGMFSDVTSAFTDFFGTQSGAYNKKIRSGEDLCRASMRAQCLELSGSAIVGVDVDYAEVGGQRAMLMVCMTGTAVRLTNPEIVSPDYETIVSDIQIKRARYRQLITIARNRNLI